MTSLQIGLIVVPSVELRPGRVLPMLRWEYVSSSYGRCSHTTTHSPFWSEGASLIALFVPNEALVGSSLALTLLDFPLHMSRLRRLGRGTFVACIPPGSLRTAGVAGVIRPFTWGQRDEIRWKDGLPPFTRIEVSPPSLSLLRRTYRGHSPTPSSAKPRMSHTTCSLGASLASPTEAMMVTTSWS